VETFFNTKIYEYKIFKSPNGKYEAIKQGWSWPGFFFKLWWTLIKRLWYQSLIILVGSLVLGTIEVVLEVNESESLFPFFSFIVGLILGRYGNQWREKNLLKRNHEYKGTLSATSPEKAIEYFLS